jgi:hypothetical protein
MVKGRQPGRTDQTFSGDGMAKVGFTRLAEFVAYIDMITL